MQRACINAWELHGALSFPLGVESCYCSCALHRLIYISCRICILPAAKYSISAEMQPTFWRPENDSPDV